MENNIPEHYKIGDYQPLDIIEVILGIGAFEIGNIIKYILRFHKKNGIEDLQKAEIYLDRLIKKNERYEKLINYENASKYIKIKDNIIKNLEMKQEIKNNIYLFLDYLMECELNKCKIILEKLRSRIKDETI